MEYLGLDQIFFYKMDPPLDLDQTWILRVGYRSGINLNWRFGFETRSGAHNSILGSTSPQNRLIEQGSQMEIWIQALKTLKLQYIQALQAFKTYIFKLLLKSVPEYGSQYLVRTYKDLI
eukprot:TRINITY_DN3760_c0_g2_i1.p1 TRINITY_DN3760_c0_g2~~TRINITY_DN3760_c0_g2_i1.p1  ORF type:complete len:119 (-),score=2.51 TRINITY_DN3760_c0_g2_i1:478-834(-)